MNPSPKSPGPVKQKWEEFAAEFCNYPVDSIPYDSMRGSFYAGACVVSGIMNKIAQVPKSEGIELLRSLQDDLTAFIDDTAFRALQLRKQEHDNPAANPAATSADSGTS